MNNYQEKAAQTLKKETTATKQTLAKNARVKLSERDCPRCEAVLIHNNNEQCYECLNCGYIDCGGE